LHVTKGRLEKSGAFAWNSDKSEWAAITDEAREWTQTLKFNAKASPKPAKKHNMGVITGAPINLDTSGSVFDHVAGHWVRKDGKENTDLDQVEGFPNESMASPDPESWKGKRREYDVEMLRSKWDECQQRHKTEGGCWLNPLIDKKINSPMSLSQIRTLALKKIIADANSINLLQLRQTLEPLEFSITEVRRPAKPQMKIDFAGNEHLRNFSEDGEIDEDDDFGSALSEKTLHIRTRDGHLREDSDFEVEDWPKETETEDVDADMELQPEIEDDDLEGQIDTKKLARFNNSKVN